MTLAAPIHSMNYGHVTIHIPDEVTAWNCDRQQALIDRLIGGFLFSAVTGHALFILFATIQMNALS